MLERAQKLLYLLPIVELMEVKISDQRLVLRYNVDKKLEYKIKTKSTVDANRLKNAIE